MVSTVTTTTTTTVTTVTTVAMGDLGLALMLVPAILLVVFLGAREVVAATGSSGSKPVGRFLDVGIYPLFFVFLMVVANRVLDGLK